MEELRVYTHVTTLLKLVGVYIYMYSWRLEPYEKEDNGCLGQAKCELYHTL